MLNTTNHLLGYPDDARLLLLNADDFGMCQAVNTAILAALDTGLVRSTSLMVPCAWAPDAIRQIGRYPNVSLGIHLSVVCDGEAYKWRPQTCPEHIPTLIDPSGYFFTFDRMTEFLAKASLAELEQEFRAQIEAVLAAGLNPTHLDWHSLRINNRLDIFDLMFGLAREYGLAMRAFNQAFSARVKLAGLPANDHEVLDSYLVDPAEKPARYTRLLHELPAGLSEWAVHPGLDTPELLAIEPDSNHFRQSDTDFWTSSQARELIEAEGIILINYRSLQAAYR